MSQQTKRELVERMKGRYERMGRLGKGRMLDEFCALTGHSRKHAIKLLRGTRGRRRPAGRKRRYDDEVAQVLGTLWQWTDQMCSKHLKAALPEWLPYVEREQGRLSPELRQKVLSISPAQIDRLLGPHRIHTQAWRRRARGHITESTPSSWTPRRMKGITVVGRSTPPARPQAATAPP